MVNSLAIARIAISTRNLRLSSLRLYDLDSFLPRDQEWGAMKIRGSSHKIIATQPSLSVDRA